MSPPRIPPRGHSRECWTGIHTDCVTAGCVCEAPGHDAPHANEGSEHR